MTKSKSIIYHDPVTGAEVYDLHREWETGHDRRTPRLYYFTTNELLSASDSGGTPSYGYALNSSSGDYDNAYAKAYGKFIDQIHDSSSWGTNVAELHQATSMIASRGKQLLTFTNAVKKFDIFGAAKALGLKSIPKKKRKSITLAKKASDQWLEWHFGWDPLIQDIGGAIKTLTSNPEPRTLRGRGAGSQDLSVTHQDSEGRYHQILKIQCKVLLQQRVTVTNQNLANAAALGLVNPASVAWDLVPFSFVVDWFSNVGQVLNSYTDLLGLDISGGFTTTYQTYFRSQVQTYSRPDYKPYEYFGSAKGARMTRTPGSLVRPPLVLKPFSGFSPVRGATAIALLVQGLRSTR